jgi:hypothetical protein
MTDQPHITARLIRRGETAETDFDREFWAAAGHERRFAAAWEMVDEVSLMRGGSRVTQQRLQKSVEHLKRRSI